MTKKTVLFTLTLFLLLLLPSVTSAEERKVNINSSERTERMENKIERSVTKFEERKVANENKLREAKKERVLNYWKNTKESILGMIERLTNLVSRVETRVGKLAEANPSKDFSNIRSQIAKAKTLLADAKSKVEGLDTNLSATLKREEVKDAFKTHVSTIGLIRKDIMEVYKILKQIVIDIKALNLETPRGTKTPSATSVVTPTP